MNDINSLSNRLDAQFQAAAEKTKKFQSEQLEEHQARQKRLEQLAKIFEELREVWKPRLDLLMGKLGERVKVTPRIVPSTRSDLRGAFRAWRT